MKEKYALNLIMNIKDLSQIYRWNYPEVMVFQTEFYENNDGRGPDLENRFFLSGIPH